MDKALELKIENDILKKTNEDLQDRLDGVYRAYETLRYKLERCPDEHTLLALKSKINQMEELLDREVKGWRFLLKGNGNDKSNIQNSYHPMS